MVSWYQPLNTNPQYYKVLNRHLGAVRSRWAVKCTMTTHCIVQSRVQIRYHTTICSPGHTTIKNGWHFPFQVPHF